MKAMLIIHGGSIGDVLLALPAIESLRCHWPGAHLHLICKPAAGKLLKEYGIVRETSAIGSARFLPLFSPEVGIPEELARWAGRFDLGIVWLKGGEVLANRLKETGLKQVLAAAPYPDEIGSVHVSDHLLQTLTPLDIQTSSLLLGLSPPEPVNHFAAELSRAKKTPVVAIHPGSGSTRKNWPACRFARVADWVSEQVGGSVMVIAGPADDECVEKMLCGMAREPAIVIRRARLSEVAAVLARCDAYVGNDSGITHLAACVATPTIALFGPTDARVWAPGGKHVFVIQGQANCAPCLHSMRSTCAKSLCLEDIGITRVLEVLAQVLEQA